MSKATLGNRSQQEINIYDMDHLEDIILVEVEEDR
jgi:hypothetical protein